MKTTAEWTKELLKTLAKYDKAHPPWFTKPPPEMFWEILGYKK